MRKYLLLFLPIFILTGALHMQTLCAVGEDEANKYYLDAYNLYKLGKMDESMEMLKKVVTVNPNHAEAHFGMGSIYFRQNMFDDAIKEFTKVTRIKPEYVEAYQRLWLAYKKLGMNDKAEQELLKYKKLIEERMQAMGGASPQVAKPVTPPPKREEEAEEEEKPSETRPPETTTPKTSVAESRPPEPEIKEERSVVVKPVTPAPEEPKPSVVESRPPVIPQTNPIQVRPAVEPPKLPSETVPTTKVDTDHTSPYIKVEKRRFSFKSLLNPFKRMSSTLFKSPFKKSVDKLEKPYIGKFMKGFVYYIVGVQLWLCVVATLCIYFRKAKRE